MNPQTVVIDSPLRGSWKLKISLVLPSAVEPHVKDVKVRVCGHFVNWLMRYDSTEKLLFDLVQTWAHRTRVKYAIYSASICKNIRQHQATIRRIIPPGSAYHNSLCFVINTSNVIAASYFIAAWNIVTTLFIAFYNHQISQSCTFITIEIYCPIIFYQLLTAMYSIYIFFYFSL